MVRCIYALETYIMSILSIAGSIRYSEIYILQEPITDLCTRENIVYDVHHVHRLIKHRLSYSDGGQNVKTRLNVDR